MDETPSPNARPIPMQPLLPRCTLLSSRPSYDGINYDTADLTLFDNDFRPGKTARKTLELDTKVRFIKVLVENLDESESISDVRVIATLAG